MRVARPELYRDLRSLLEQTSGKAVIARGAGLSYPAASFSEDAVSIDMTRFNRVLGFDHQSGTIRVEPGLSIGSLCAFLEQKRRFVPVLPGYPDITVGGCVAFDVHGKSQFHAGTFFDWVESIELFHPDHGKLICSREDRPDLFHLTVGGFGLTGVITAVELRTKSSNGSSILIERLPVGSLIEAVDVMRQRANSVDCLYSWHNLNRHRRFGVGVVYSETFSPETTSANRKRRLLSPSHRLPLPLWNGLTTSAAMHLYGWKEASSGKKLQSLHQASFPIEGLEHYYASFGRRGFREYQVIVPFGGWPEYVEAIKALLSQSQVPVTLASLKLFKGARRNLTFSSEGVCLAIDVPTSARSLRVFQALDELSATFGATINISKDSRISSSLCQRLFPSYDSFRDQLRAFDPNRRLKSILRERIGV